MQVRVGDRVYVCSTGNGTILELSYPNMALVRCSGRTSARTELCNLSKRLVVTFCLLHTVLWSLL